MNPKEKAIKLVDKFDETLTYLESKEKAKECAFILIDEIIKSDPKYPILEIDKDDDRWINFTSEEIRKTDTLMYWNLVKTEIEKL